MAFSIPVFEYAADKPGIHLLMLGGIHGDEVCGPVALSRLRLELDADLLKLECGKLTIAPICNPLAYKGGKRFIHDNLNRIIGHYPKPKHEEEGFASAVAALIDHADVVVDLHSYTSGMLPFLFLDDPAPATRSLAAAQQIAHWVTGWPTLPPKESQGASEIDTLGFARSCGKVGIVVECGQHNDPSAIPVAYRCVRNTLAHLGMAAAGAESLEVSPQIDRVETVHRRKGAGKFVSDWQHLCEVVTGQPIARYGACQEFRVGRVRWRQRRPPDAPTQSPAYS